MQESPLQGPGRENRLAIDREDHISGGEPPVRGPDKDSGRSRTKLADLVLLDVAPERATKDLGQDRPKQGIPAGPFRKR